MERLDVTKAALYYHFERKEDILLELHLRLHALGWNALDYLDSLDSDQQRADAWPAVLDRFIDLLLSNRELILLHLRNYNALDQMHHDERHVPRTRTFNSGLLASSPAAISRSRNVCGWPARSAR